MSELVLVVSSVARSAAFYRDVVGLELLEPMTEDWAWFWTGEPEHSTRLAVHQGPLLFEEHSPRPEDQRFGPVHFALEVPRDRLAEAVTQVESHGIPVYGPVHFDWMSADSFYFYDPDGNLVEWWSPD